MALDYEKFRFKDGVTPLSAKELNARFFDQIHRIHELEFLGVDWKSAISEIQNAGVERIDGVIMPLINQLAAATSPNMKPPDRPYMTRPRPW